MAHWRHRLEKKHLAGDRDELANLDSWRCGRNNPKVSNKVGCIGERSVPITTAEGCASARQSYKSKIEQIGTIRGNRPNSIAHKPVPVPTSRTFWTSFLIGAKNIFPSMVKPNR